MKKKLILIPILILALVLALSSSLVATVTASPDSTVTLASEGAATAEWSTEKVNNGSYSVKLYVGNGSVDWAEVSIPVDIALKDITELKFWEYIESYAPKGWSVNVLLGIDADGDGVFEADVAEWHVGSDAWTLAALSGDTFVQMDGASGSPTTGTWTETDALSVAQWWTPDKSGAGFAKSDTYPWTFYDTLTNFINVFIPDPTQTSLIPDTAAHVKVIKLVIGGSGSWMDETAFVDGVTINGILYELEPPLPPLDEDYYSVGDQPTVTIYDANANLDPMAIDIIAMDATPAALVVSTTDAVGDALVLTETGADTGVFTGSFTLLDEAPADRDLDQIVVSEGDTITLTYSELSATALVDDTAPEITVVSPADGATEADATPVISASYSDATAGIDQLSVEMLVNGVEVDAVADGDDVTYTPSEPLAEGSHNVTVNVSDNAGNEATESWSFRIASWLVEPVSGTDVGELDALDTVGVAVSITGTTGDIEVGRYASNPQPEVALTFSVIEDGFFDVKVTDAVGATQIVIKFAASGITAETTAYVWDELVGAWLECSDQGYNSLDEFLWVKVRTKTTPNIAELEGTPFAISGITAGDILFYYRGYSGDAEVVETTDLLKAANDWADEVVPPGFTEAISTTQLLALANEWAAN